MATDPQLAGSQVWAVDALGALAHETRLSVFRMLVQAGPDGLIAGAIAEAAHVPPSTMSHHLATLERAGLLQSERASRQITYRADFAAMRTLIAFLLEDCCKGAPDLCADILPPLSCSPANKDHPMTDRIFNVLFLCTGNSARSILAESLLTQLGAGRFRAFSAGSMPKGDVHPMALEVLTNYHLPHAGFRSKSWQEFAAPGAPHMDFVITVCDNAAGESCPVWPGQPMTAHWGIADPAAAEGAGQTFAFVEALGQMRRRIELFTALPVTALEKLELESRVRQIGKEAGATALAKGDA